MRMNFKAMFWRMTVLAMTIMFWVSVVAAQDEVEAVEETSNLSSIMPIFLTGFAVVAFLGISMYTSDMSNNSDDS